MDCDLSVCSPRPTGFGSQPLKSRRAAYATIVKSMPSIVNFGLIPRFTF